MKTKISTKICGVSNSKILEHLINHSHHPKYIGFIVNYPNSKRFVNYKNLKELLKINKKNSKYVAVLVKPNKDILEKIKLLPFDYYQIYDCSPNKIKSIRDVADIFLFDSKGYEKSLSFDHNLIKSLKLNKELMLAGNIQVEDNLKNYKEIADIIDISGGLETSGLKDISKINIFLEKIKQINNET